VSHSLFTNEKSEETGSNFKNGKFRTVLFYPAGYRAGMASLGFLSIFSKINSRPKWSCERAFFSGDKEPVVSLESSNPLTQFPIAAFSIAWEGELFNLIKMLKSSGVNPLRKERKHYFPLIISGGPLTTVAPDLLFYISDIIFVGEAEETFDLFMEIYEEELPREELLERVNEIDGIWVPSLSSEISPPAPMVPIEKLPALSRFTSPLAEFGARLLVEIERGCSRGCAFCSMSRRARGFGMRSVPFERLKELLNPVPPAIGLVGAAVTDYPWIKDLLRFLIENKSDVSLSSLRADRLDDELLSLLKKGGLKTLTIAADGPSESMRKKINKGITATHLLNAAKLAKAHGIRKMKLYQMTGFPNENDDDIKEMAALALELTSFVNLSVTLSPLVPKPFTPLCDVALPEEKYIKKSVKLFKKLAKGRIEIRPVSWRDAALEYLLDKGGREASLTVMKSIEEGWSRGVLIRTLTNQIK
jgi:radical SAM superfamily enzyme YgiQ (UPF0313 family)